MPRKQTSEPPSPPTLLVPRHQAANRIGSQLEKGHEIDRLAINSYVDLRQAEDEHSKWTKYNNELLTRLFSTKAIANEYSWSGSSISYRDPDLSQEVDTFKNTLHGELRCLESILERLELIPEPVAADLPASKESIHALNKNIFLVHGHDEGAKQSIARFIERLGLYPIILHEQPNMGRTIIEKFEHHSDVGYAVIVLTPDDIGAARSEPDNIKSRARQNVIFELGYFIGKLGRGRVCALYKEEVEIPSDFMGVLYIPLDKNGAWQFSLAREMKQCGLEVDLNKAV
ncbi:MAG: nucleotide-binding protein [Acidobacteriota bacterium]|nr:nucleotide-binding protein [Acidobacteriota bacterium]